MTSSTSEGRSVNSGASESPFATTRLWGTAHLTAAVVFAAALVCCAARLPGQTLDARPLPVPSAGWLVWISGIGFLAGCAVLHARTGFALRNIGVRKHAGIPLVALIAGVSASGTVALVTGISIVLGPQSRTYACGLETLTAVLCVAATLSASLLVVICFRRPYGERTAARWFPRGFAVLLVHLGFAILTTGGFLWLEQLPLTA